MRETKVNEIIGMIEDKRDDNRLMRITDPASEMRFRTWVRLDLIRETLREVPDDEN